MSFLSGAGSCGGLHHPPLPGWGPTGREWCHSGCLGNTGKRSHASFTDSLWVSWSVGIYVQDIFHKEKGAWCSQHKWLLKPKQWINFKSNRPPPLWPSRGSAAISAHTPLEALCLLHTFHCGHSFYPQDFIFCSMGLRCFQVTMQPLKQAYPGQNVPAVPAGGLKALNSIKDGIIVEVCTE